nr:4-hydroxyphenylpyruvate dioxygenase [Ipomoea trifida]
MRKRSGIGGFEFLSSPLPTYYKNLKSRSDDVLNDEQIKEYEELTILVDRDYQGTVLQIFTKPVGDRISPFDLAASGSRHCLTLPFFMLQILQRLPYQFMKEEIGDAVTESAPASRRSLATTAGDAVTIDSNVSDKYENSTQEE